jgi:hypothetical protein
MALDKKVGIKISAKDNASKSLDAVGVSLNEMKQALKEGGATLEDSAKELAAWNDNAKFSSNITLK